MFFKFSNILEGLGPGLGLAWVWHGPGQMENDGKPVVFHCFSTQAGLGRVLGQTWIWPGPGPGLALAQDPPKYWKIGKTP